MYGTLALTAKALDDYTSLVGEATVAELQSLARPLRGLRVLNLSVTAFGTAVADLLNAAVPLLCDLGLDASWQVIRPAEEFDALSKALYQALSGTAVVWSQKMTNAWLRYSATNAELLTEPYDVIVIHDPQPVAIRTFAPEEARRHTRWIFHSHLDLTSAQEEAWLLLRDHVQGYDAILFPSEAFARSDLGSVPLRVVRPAIDPLGPRDMELGAEAIRAILEQQGLDLARPSCCLVAPCDPASDLLGAIDAYRLAVHEAPGLQLVLIATTVPEDPAPRAYYQEVADRVREEPDVHLLSSLNAVGNVEMNAFQRAAAVILHRGLRRGFPIWVADALWKEKPVVSSPGPEIEDLVVDGCTGLLATSVEEFAAAIVRLLREPGLAPVLGRGGRRHVADRFLITRYLADYLRLLAT